MYIHVLTVFSSRAAHAFFLQMACSSRLLSFAYEEHLWAQDLHRGVTPRNNFCTCACWVCRCWGVGCWSAGFWVTCCWGLGLMAFGGFLGSLGRSSTASCQLWALWGVLDRLDAVLGRLVAVENPSGTAPWHSGSSLETRRVGSQTYATIPKL